MAVADRIFKSSIGSKAIVAASGLALILFILGHIAGNLLVFAGPEALNAYATKLHDLGALLWIARAGLLVAFVVHVAFAIKLHRQNKNARPVRYAKEATIQASWASTHMIHTGLVMLAFLIFHLAHFTFRVTSPDVASHGEFEVYQMVTKAFQDPLVISTYIFAMICIGFHLSHGISSFMQTLGLNHPMYNKKIRSVGRSLAWSIAALYISIPTAAFLGLIG